MSPPELPGWLEECRGRVSRTEPWKAINEELYKLVQSELPHYGDGTAQRFSELQPEVQAVLIEDVFQRYVDTNPQEYSSFTAGLQCMLEDGLMRETKRGSCIIR
jgi:hypothetical protein